MKVELKIDVGASKAGDIVTPRAVEYKRVPVKQWELLNVTVENDVVAAKDLTVIEP